MKGPNKKDKPVEEQSWMICIIRCQLHKAIIITPQQKGIPVFQNVHSTTIHKAPNWKPPKYPSIAKQIHRLWCGHREEQSTPWCRCPRCGAPASPPCSGDRPSARRDAPQDQRPRKTSRLAEVGLRRAGWPCHSKLNPTLPISELLTVYSLLETLIIIKTANTSHHSQAMSGSSLCTCMY